MPGNHRQRINVLVVDDHSLVCEFIKDLLNKAPDIDVVGDASTGEEAITVLDQLNPDVILMDVQMPGMGGLEATRQLKSMNPDVKVVILTSCNDDIILQCLLESGISGYLTKTKAGDEIVKAVRFAYEGKHYVSPDIASQLALRCSQDTPKVPLDLLSQRELQICLLIVSGKRVPDIAKELKLSPKTVNSYRYRIFDKLNIVNDVSLTRLVMRYSQTSIK